MKRITLNDTTQLRLFITGKPGAGKNVTCCKLHQSRYSLTVLAIRLSIRRLQLPHTVDVVDIERFSEINAVYDWLVKGSTRKPRV
jgi:broad-specificity NMP kinase